MWPQQLGAEVVGGRGRRARAPRAPASRTSPRPAASAIGDGTERGGRAASGRVGSPSVLGASRSVVLVGARPPARCRTPAWAALRGAVSAEYDVRRQVGVDRAGERAARRGPGGSARAGGAVGRRSGSPARRLGPPASRHAREDRVTTSSSPRHRAVRAPADRPAGAPNSIRCSGEAGVLRRPAPTSHDLGLRAGHRDVEQPQRLAGVLAPVRGAVVAPLRRRRRRRRRQRCPVVVVEQRHRRARGGEAVPERREVDDGVLAGPCCRGS